MRQVHTDLRPRAYAARSQQPLDPFAPIDHLSSARMVRQKFCTGFGYGTNTLLWPTEGDRRDHWSSFPRAPDTHAVTRADIQYERRSQERRAAWARSELRKHPILPRPYDDQLPPNHFPYSSHSHPDYAYQHLDPLSARPTQPDPPGYLYNSHMRAPTHVPNAYQYRLGTDKTGYTRPGLWTQTRF